MWTTKASPTARPGSPVDDMSIPEASMATWPSGLLTTAKTSAGSAGMMRWTSNRSSFSIGEPCHSRPSAAREADHHRIRRRRRLS